MEHKVAIVTGGNKGIGYAIVKELCLRGVGVVYLTARDVNRGTEAVKKLQKEGLGPLFYQLDITDSDSVQNLADHLKSNHGGLDVLINNAAVIGKDYHKYTYEDSKQVIDTNYFSVLTVQKYLFPILKDNARVVNISSDAGHISHLRNQYWIERLIKKDINVDDINSFVDWFLISVKDGTLSTNDFDDLSILPYRISKMALCALTRLQQNEVRRGILVNSIHPGFVQTDITNQYGTMLPEDAGKAPVYLALDVDKTAKGKFFWFDKTERDWADPSLKFEDLYTENSEHVLEVFDKFLDTQKKV